MQFNYQLKRFNLSNHIHQFAELVYSVDGEVLVTINRSVIPLRERDFLFIMPMIWGITGIWMEPVAAAVLTEIIVFVWRES